MSRWAIYTYTLPLKRPILARGAHRFERKGLLLFRTVKGETRVGEAAPIQGFHPHTHSQVCTELIAYCSHPQPEKRNALSPLARFALEMTEQEVPSATTPIQINGLLSLTAPIDPSFSCYKIKVGRTSLKEEVDFLLRMPLPNHARLRLDANRAWSVSEALAFWDDIRPLHSKIEYIEEPLQDPQLLHTLPLPIAVDESLPDLKERCWDIQALRAIILKPTLQDGISGTKWWIQQASDRNIDAVISSTFESSIGIHALCNLAALQPSTIHGLGTASWFAADLIPQRALPEKGFLLAGVAVNPEEIDRRFLRLEARG